MGVMVSGKPSTRDINLAVIVGNNPIVSHQTYPFGPGESGAPSSKSLAAVKARGGRIIVVDPRRTETARYADLLIQPLPGNDAALFAAIAHILLRDGTYNKTFCKHFVTQLDTLRELVAKRADVPVEQIELAAKWLGEAKRSFVGSGTGPSMSAHSNGELPTALLPQEILTPGPDKIRALIVFGGNPIMALGDPERAVPVFKDLELLVCLDARMNETAQLAHYVIATTQHFERHDLSIPGDSLYPEAFAQYAPPIISKPGDTIDGWEFWGIASRMKI